MALELFKQDKNELISLIHRIMEITSFQKISLADRLRTVNYLNSLRVIPREMTVQVELSTDGSGRTKLTLDCNFIEAKNALSN